MNNKKLGTEWEQEFCELLSKRGYWVHFLNPSKSGAQPFDVICAKNGQTFVYDCKTSARGRFPITRLEDNQILAFEKWLKCGNTMPLIAIKYHGMLFIVLYSELKESGSINLNARLGTAIPLGTEQA